MAVYQSPGVYVKELPGGSKPIEGVGTAIAAFVGFTEKGPTGVATRISNAVCFTPRRLLARIQLSFGDGSSTLMGCSVAWHSSR